MLIAILVGLAGFTIIQQTKDNSLANVQRVQGKYVFFMSEPVNEYETVLTVKAPAIKLGGTNTDDWIQNMISRVNKKLTKNNTEWDAVITNDGIRGIAIKFKE